MHADYKDNLALRRRPSSARNTNPIILIDSLNKTHFKF